LGLLHAAPVAGRQKDHAEQKNEGYGFHEKSVKVDLDPGFASTIFVFSFLCFVIYLSFVFCIL
jgi:hypothetical protein